VSDRLRLALQFDAAAMRRDLLRLEQGAWVDHFVKQNYDGAWTVLPLRAAEGAQHPIATIYSDPSAEAFVDTPLLARCAYFQQVLASFQCPLHAVRLMKLAPGSIIKPHSDHDLAAEYGKARLHIPVITNPGVEFWLNGERVVMGEGECWYLNLSAMHSVANRGDADRIHLVVDAVVNPWLEEQMMKAERAAARSAGSSPAPELRPQPLDAGPVPGDLEQFRAAVRQDLSLQRRLRDIEDRGAFVALVAQVASESACRTNPGEIEDAMRATRRLGHNSAIEPAERPRTLDATPELTGWIPFRIREAGSQPLVDWCYLGQERFTAPFFSDTIASSVRKPFNQLFLQETPIDRLIDRSAAHAGLRPAAFVFHGSRCGSTLMAQMAAALPGTVVISEAAPIDHVLQAPVSEDTRLEWLRALISVLGQPRRGEDRRLIVKFDAWHVVHIALIQRAFPGVPSVFLYRDPAALLASQLRMPGLHTVPGTLDPSVIGLDLAAAMDLDREEYSSRVLGSFYEAAAGHAAEGRVTLINYADLPQGAFTQVLDWCGPADRDDALERLRHVSQFDSKTPSLPYDATPSSRPAPSQRAIDMADRFIGPHYDRLEAIRLDQARRVVPGSE
jgi:quercetin dioxygenase-like cupin family protein